MVAQNPGRKDYSSLLMVCLYQRQKVRHGKTYTCKPPPPPSSPPPYREPTADEVLNYVTAVFEGTLLAWPGAYLIVTGKKAFLEGAVRKLKDRRFPLHKILTVPDWEANTWNMNPESRFVKFEIEYKPLRKISVQFTPASGGSPVEVHFEITPDGKVVETGGQLVLLKKFLENKSGQVVKVAVKLKGLAQFDLATQNKVKTELKGKITGVYEVAVTKGVSVELYLDTFVKHATEKDPDDPTKPQTKFGVEGGAGVKFYW
jgi:hypothetical protein